MKKKFMPGIYRLKGVTKHYDWGGVSFIPSLLQLENIENKPFAEYWLGTHPLGISFVEQPDGDAIALTSYVNNLPYLLKLLDVKNMLSIQVHPAKEAAEKEFARENAGGIPLDSPHRNYKDNNHKPELMVALSDFWLLHGFKPQEELVYTLLNVVELRELLPVFNQSGYEGLYKFVMELKQEDVNRILQPLIDNIDSTYQEGGLDKYDEDFWAARASKAFSMDGNIDRGIFSIYFFNLVHLKKGEGIYQAAGVPHAYLEGQNVEIMANSDNVLRGGLTSKQIDVKELMKHIKCEPTLPHIIPAEEINSNEKLYKTPATDFQLGIIELKKAEISSFVAVTTEILLLTEGSAEISNGKTTLELKPGMPSLLVLPGDTIQIKTMSNATVFRASEPAYNR